MKSITNSVSLLLAVAAPAQAQLATPDRPGNPFARFFGEWTLKDDRFQQVWDGKTVETLTTTAVNGESDTTFIADLARDYATSPASSDCPVDLSEPDDLLACSGGL